MRLLPRVLRCGPLVGWPANGVDGALRGASPAAFMDEPKAVRTPVADRVARIPSVTAGTASWILGHVALAASQRREVHQPVGTHHHLHAASVGGVGVVDSSSLQNRLRPGASSAGKGSMSWL